MALLSDDPRSSMRPHGRRTTGLWCSVAGHAAVVALILVTVGAPATPPAPRMRPLKVFMPALLPPAPVVTPRLPAPLPPPPPAREPAAIEAPTPRPAAPIVATIEEPAPPPPAAPAPAVEPPLAKPEVQRPVETGLFDRTTGARPNQAAAPVTTGGFGTAAAAPRDGVHAPGAVTTGGFGSVARSPRTASVSGEVQTAGFDQRASAPVQRSAAAKPVDRPVEITFKPTPEYTDAARAARIEGTVSLELEFTATGDVRLLRVVRGLGHGLDEAAERAALRIRFTPAQADGRPVDSRATVHITFRLS